MDGCHTTREGDEAKTAEDPAHATAPTTPSVGAPSVTSLGDSPTAPHGTTSGHDTASLPQQLRNHETRIRGLRQEVAQLRSALAASEARNDRLQDRLAASEARNDWLHDRCTDSLRRVQLLEELVRAKDAELRLVTAQFDEKLQKVNERHKRDMQELGADMQELRAELRADMQELRAKMQELRADTQELGADMQELQLRAKMQELRADTQELRAEMQALRADNVSLREAVQELRSAREETRDKFKEGEALLVAGSFARFCQEAFTASVCPGHWDLVSVRDVVDACAEGEFSDRVTETVQHRGIAIAKALGRNSGPTPWRRGLRKFQRSLSLIHHARNHHAHRRITVKEVLSAIETLGDTPVAKALKAAHIAVGTMFAEGELAERLRRFHI